MRSTARTAAHVFVLGLLVMAAPGCDVAGLESGSIVVSLQSSDLLISAGHPGSYEVVARNASDSRVEWGEGSSSCQLDLLVITPLGEQFSAGVRACTKDFATQGLDAGQSRTELIEWGGSVFRDGGEVALPAGEYRLLGKAGTVGESESLTVELVVIP